MPGQSKIELQKAGGGLVFADVLGEWRMGNERPSAAAVAVQLEAAGAKQVAFRADQLEGWDGALPSYLFEIMKKCRVRGLTVDISRLPDGLRRLMNLALAVPERPGARRAAVHVSFLEYAV